MVKVRVAIPLLNPMLPERLEAREPTPAVGTVWVKFKVKPDEKDCAGVLVLLVVTTKSPKLAPRGVLPVFDVPLKVNVTMLAPLPLVRTLVPEAEKIDPAVVLNETGTAWAVVTPRAVIPMTIAPRRALVFEMNEIILIFVI